MKIKNLIEINDSNGKGFCRSCETYFKKGDVFIILEKSRINQIIHYKICAKCYLKYLSDKVGWKQVNALITEIIEEKI